MTAAYTLPDLHEPIRALLLADAEFAALTGGRLATRAPDDVTAPYAVFLCEANPLSESSRSVGWRGTVRLNGCATRPVGAVLPETLAWRICAAAARVLDRSGQQTWAEDDPDGRTVTYTPRLTDGPLAMTPDTSRGPETVVYWRTIRATFPIHLR
ncbi:tail completion protein gp17 [Amycolatopsis sp. CA-161197]|uniref:tail completion protein gp17 n=1 Tax=Amycolatopsis sp. CA-161197 TaxID=3239922 RepID=UPI003D91C36D